VKQRLGLIGFGAFGQFIAPYLTKRFDVTVYDQRDVRAEAAARGVRVGALDEAAGREIVVYGLPVQYLEEVLRQSRPFLRPDALLLDVASVKARPLALLEKYAPATAEICGLHPLFGPQSGQHGIAGLNVTICPTRTTRAACIAAYLRDELGLNVHQRTPAEHDQRMAYVQALTHFIARALEAMDVPDAAQKTVAYQYLLDIKANLAADSWDLFLTIEGENPYAAEVRERFVKELQELQRLLA
jgi:prephenate dehydrogenase